MSDTDFQFDAGTTINGANNTDCLEFCIEVEVILRTQCNEC